LWWPRNLQLLDAGKKKRIPAYHAYMGRGSQRALAS
jgi:hypothetical protein